MSGLLPRAPGGPRKSLGCLQADLVDRYPPPELSAVRGTKPRDAGPSGGQVQPWATILPGCTRKELGRGPGLSVFRTPATPDPILLELEYWADGSASRPSKVGSR